MFDTYYETTIHHASSMLTKLDFLSLGYECCSYVAEKANDPCWRLIVGYSRPQMERDTPRVALKSAQRHRIQIWSGYGDMLRVLRLSWNSVLKEIKWYQLRHNDMMCKHMVIRNG